MADRIFQGTTNSDFNTASNWDGGIALPAAGDNIQISADCLMDANDTNVYGTLLIDTSRNFNIATFDFNCGAATANGTLTIGISANTGFTCAGLTLNYSPNFNNFSKINNSGNFTATVLHIRGYYTQTDNCTWISTNVNSYFFNFTLNVDKILSIGNGNYLSVSFGTMTINGIIATGTSTTATLFSHAANLIFGINSDITGSGFTLNFTLYDATHILTNNRTTPFTFSGTIEINCTPSNNLYIPVANWDKSIYVNPGYGSNEDVHMMAGTLYCKSFIFDMYSNNNITFHNNVYNGSFVASGSVLFTAYGGTITYLKGTSNWTLIGNSSNIDFNYKTVENLIINCTTGQIKTILSNFTTDSLTITAGTLDLNAKTLTSSGAISLTGTLLNSTGSATLSGTNFTTESGAVITPTGSISITITGNIAINTNTTINAGTKTWTLTNTSGIQTIDFNSKNIGALVINGNGSTKQISNNFTCSSLTLSAGILDDNGKIITVSGDVLLTSTLTHSGTLVLTGTNNDFNMNNVNRTLVNLTINSGADYDFIDGQITIGTFVCNGTAIFDVADDDTNVTNISGNGTLSSKTAATKYIYYSGTNTFSGTLDNVVLEEAGFQIPQSYYGIEINRAVLNNI